MQIYLKEPLAKVTFCEFCEIVKNTFFAEHLRVTACDIRVQVVVIYNLNLIFAICNNKLYIFSSASFHAGACFNVPELLRRFAFW